MVETYMEPCSHGLISSTYDQIDRELTNNKSLNEAKV